jgi:hypothetical protein
VRHLHNKRLPELRLQVRNQYHHPSLPQTHIADTINRKRHHRPTQPFHTVLLSITWLPKGGDPSQRLHALRLQWHTRAEKRYLGEGAAYYINPQWLVALP